MTDPVPPADDRPADPVPAAPPASPGPSASAAPAPGEPAVPQRLTLPPAAPRRPAGAAGDADGPVLPPLRMLLDRVGVVRRRRERIAAGIERAQTGDYLIPTWLLGVITLVLVAGVITLIVLS